jgi:hypothetical protein
MANQEENSSRQDKIMNSDYLTDVIAEISAGDRESQEETKIRTAEHKATDDIFSSLLSNPELLAKLPSLISSVKPILDVLSSRPEPKSAPPEAAQSTQAASVTKSKGKYDRHAALLCAMKPYLSRDRQNTIDYIIKLSRLGDILKNL